MIVTIGKVIPESLHFVNVNHLYSVVPQILVKAPIRLPARLSGFTQLEQIHRVVITYHLRNEPNRNCNRE